MDFLRQYPLLSPTAAVTDDNIFVLTYPQVIEGLQNSQVIAVYAELLNSLDR